MTKPTIAVLHLLPLLLMLPQLVACAGSAPPRRYFLLDAAVPEQTLRLEPPVRVGLRDVTVAPYLAQPGLVVETDTHEVKPARYHEWAEPLAAGLRTYLRTEISSQLGYDIAASGTRRNALDYLLDVDIERFHGTLSGEARLVASWRISRGTGAPIAEYRFASQAPLPREGYEGLVDAEVELARQLAAAIAESLREVESGGTRTSPDR